MHLYQIFPFFRSNFQIKSERMVTKYFKVFVFLVLPLSTTAQSLNVSVQGTSGNNASAFALSEGSVSFDKAQVRFPSGAVISNFLDYGVSPDLSVVGFLSTAGGNSKALVMDSEGDTLSSFDVTSLSSDDPSVAVYPSNTGAVLVRDNIASFSFYDTFGQIITQVTSSSQSKEGEAISEVAMDPRAQTIVIYNPQIKRNGQLGSQAQLLNASNKLENVYSNSRRVIKNVVVSSDGQFIMLLTASSGSEDEIVIMDRFGNELNVINTDEDIQDVRLSGDAEYITLISERRVLVFDMLQGKRLGSTSLRSPLVVAEYFPEDEIILAMTGDVYSATGIVNNIDFHAIHLGKRQVARESLSSSVRLNGAIRHDLIRTGSSRYRLKGANKQIEIRAAF